MKNVIFVKFHTIPPEKDEASGTYYPAVDIKSVAASAQCQLVVYPTSTDRSHEDSSNKVTSLNDKP